MLTNYMNKFSLVLICAAVVSTSCRKSIQVPVTDADTAFDVSGTDVYLKSEMSVTAKTSLNAAYDWDFGDGTAHESGTMAKHTYTKSGKFTITLKIGGLTSSKRIRVMPGELSYQVKNSLDRDYYSYQARILDPSGSPFYTANGNLITKGSVTDTIFVNIGSNRIGSDILVDGTIYSDRGNALKFGIGGTLNKGTHSYIEMTPATLGNFYQTSGNIALPGSAVTIGTAIANY
ncbi:hypothetical protein GCM10027037_04150 [Mucilaginibacter koreensis]